jgi:D-arabinose 1-dehydrogenase-like Zn-dependent alcohol dehydrogenase
MNKILHTSQYYISHISDHALPITHHALRNMSHMKQKTICVVGLGYVGLPLAKAFSKHLKTIGFDVDNEKIRLLNNDNEENIEFSTDSSKIKHADFVIIAVPTPVTKSKELDLSYVKLFCFAKTFTKKCLRYQPQKLSVRT